MPLVKANLVQPSIPKVTLGKLGNKEQTHIAVDPTLLLIKAAVVVSARLGERLLPSCPIEASDWDSGDEAWAKAYLEQERSQWLPPNEVRAEALNLDDESISENDEEV